MVTAQKFLVVWALLPRCRMQLHYNFICSQVNPSSSNISARHYWKKTSALCVGQNGATFNFKITLGNVPGVPKSTPRNSANF